MLQWTLFDELILLTQNDNRMTNKGLSRDTLNEAPR
jgi:hypothetical protein